MSRLACLVVFAFATLAPVSVAAARRLPATETEISVAASAVLLIDGSPSERARLTEAVALFEEQDMPLPALEVRFHSTKVACQGNLGLFRSTVTPWRVDVCSEKKWVLPHELAHAWVAVEADEKRQAAYVATHGLPTWGDESHSWHDRGVEHAAHAIQQNLMLADVIDARLPQWEPLMAAYELITGRTSPLR